MREQSSTLQEKFASLREENKKAFIVYVPFGFPTPQISEKVLLTLGETGVDIIEVGIPFSDPLADGPIIQNASQVALQTGTTPLFLFEVLERLKPAIKIPLVILTYYNSVYNLGIKRFLKYVKKCGVKGVMVVDLPIEEAKEYVTQARNMEIDTIFFITPTTSKQRAKQIVKVSRGFIYYVSVTGITGPKNLFLSPIANYIKWLRGITELPICVGFGIHKRSQVREVTTFCDGVILGSAVVKFIAENYTKDNFLPQLKNFLHQFIV
ncbi:MAG: tryptophan synthase subunit alpha [Candidatus Omnitrophica bacterium 4484_70.1]|nr:MAG: tryptophan synthase subunit alpha [Candidatus Omnitrophica bacterium 4484_70.1]